MTTGLSRTADPAAANGEPLMTAKFRVPEIRPRAVVRQRLFDRLCDGANRPLTLVSAPAGAGKTVLVSSWVAAGLTPGHVAWITLDPEDVRPGVFWAYILQGLRRSGVAIAAGGARMRSAGVRLSFLTRVANAISQQREQTILILDNAEVLAQSPILGDINFLLRHASPQLRVVILSRVDPALPLHRYRLEGAVTEIRLIDLAFTLPEAGAMLAAHGLHLPDSLVATLAERTEGWAAGLRLAAMSLQGRSPEYADRLVRGFGAYREDVAEYFLEEVLDAQPADVREFLLKTSVVDELSPSLCENLSGRSDAARMLASLLHANTFVEPSGVPGSYRYHPLFRELLQVQLDYEVPGAAVSLHRRAAHWFADSGKVLQAVHHAAVIRDWTTAAAVIAHSLAIGRLLVGADAPRLTHALRDMPPDSPGSASAVVLAASALQRDEPDACAGQLARARAELGAAEHPETAVRISMDAVEMLLAARHGDVPKALAAAARAEGGLGPEGTIPVELTALIACGRSKALLWAGDFPGAEETLGAAICTSARPGAELVRLDLLGHLAFLNALWGRLRRAAAVGQQAIALAEQCGLVVERRLPVVNLALAWAYVDEYNMPAARRQIRAVAPASVGNDPLAAAALGLIRARLFRARGEYAAAAETLRQTWGTAQRLPQWFEQQLEISRLTLPTTVPGPAENSDEDSLGGAVASLGNGGWRASDPVADLELSDEDGVPLEVRVTAYLLRSARELESGHDGAARKALERGLRLARTENLRRPIIEASPRVRGLLRSTPDVAERHRWLGAATAGAPVARPADQGRHSIVVDSLTSKEQEVLDNMAALLTTDEIARKMFVSVNTVKTHIRKILRKLSVSRRNDAIRRARELGLLQSHKAT